MRSIFTLRVQLISLIAVLLLVMTVGAGFLLTSQAEQTLMEEKTDKVKGITQQMAVYYSETIQRLEQDPQFLNASSKEQRQILEAELKKFTNIIDTSYPNIFYGYFIGEYGAPIAYRPQPQPGLSWVTDAETCDIFRDGKAVGYAFAMEDRKVILSELNRIRYVSWGTLAVLFAIGTIGAVVIGTNLSRGITTIKGGLAKMEKDLSTRLPSLSGEVGEISQAVNRLATALEEARDYTRYVLENISTGIISLDEEGKITVFNPAAEKLLGLKAEDVIGMPYEEVLKEAKIPQPKKVINLIKNHQGPEQAEVISSLKPEPMELGFTISSLYSSTGNLTGKVLTIEDLSVKRKLEEVLRRSDRLSALGLFTTGVAHEVRNPLTSIKGFAQLLSERKLLLSPGEKYIQNIVKETDRLNNLLTDLLAFAKPAPARLELRKPEEILERTLVFLEQRIKEQKIEIQRDYQFQEKMLLDEQKIQQITLNILLNALEAMPQGGTLKLKTEQEREEVVIRIADSGQGIAEENLSRIFDPFFTTKDQGTGLGLAICHRIVETLGGRIEVTSEFGKGTTASVFLPLNQEER